MTARQRRPTVLGNPACSGLAEIRLWEMIGLLGMSLPSIIGLLLRPGDLKGAVGSLCSQGPDVVSQGPSAQGTHCGHRLLLFVCPGLCSPWPNLPYFPQDTDTMRHFEGEGTKPEVRLEGIHLVCCSPLSLDPMCTACPPGCSQVFRKW